MLSELERSLGAEELSNTAQEHVAFTSEQVIADTDAWLPCGAEEE